MRCPSPNFLGVYDMLVSIFNLKFFHHRDLSFCLWYYKAQTLDLLTFKYVTIVYSLVLVMTIIGVRNLGRLTQKFQYPRICGWKLDTKSTVIHGLSGFLVLCYSECINISLLILTPVTVINANKDFTAVLLNGELEYFKGKHMHFLLCLFWFWLDWYHLCYSFLTHSVTDSLAYSRSVNPSLLKFSALFFHLKSLSLSLIHFKAASRTVDSCIDSSF